MFSFIYKKEKNQGSAQSTLPGVRERFTTPDAQFRVGIDEAHLGEEKNRDADVYRLMFKFAVSELEIDTEHVTTIRKKSLRSPS
jgi:hypothetical protein